MKKKTLLFTKNKVINFNINLTANNTIICLTDLKGNVFYWKSCGSIGFSGAKKKNPVAIEKLILTVLKFLREKNISKIIFILKGGTRKNINLIIRPILFSNLQILKFLDKTSIPFNGCRLPKPKKVKLKKNLFLF